MAGSPKKSRSERRKPERDKILSSSVKSASYNIVFQVLTRGFTFLLNAFILRYVSHDVLGICNVRLALLASSISFLSREPFRRAVLRKKEDEGWGPTVGLIWLAVPLSAAWGLIFGYIWCYVLSVPSDMELAAQYRSAVALIAVSLVIDAGSEVPYILGQYYSFAKLRIVCDTTQILVRSLFLCTFVLLWPRDSVWGYALGSLFGVLTAGGIYYGYFYYHIHASSKNQLPFNSLTQLLPKSSEPFPLELGTLAASFFAQGFLKQILTEGERYLMTFFDILAFDEQGVYDLVSNLGSLAARFVFLPVEESAYFYFAQTLERRETFTRREKKLAINTAEVLGALVKLMTLIGMTMIVYGIPYAPTLLYLYGGSSLEGPGSSLLRANCAYIFVMALNGVTEAFSFAAMTQAQLSKFNRRLLLFSAIFLAASYLFTRLFGALGFFLANSLNMALRVGQSTILIRNVFIYIDELNPFEFWKQKPRILAYFGAAGLLIILFSNFVYVNRLVNVTFGLVLFAGNLAAIYAFDGELVQFFVKMYKSKQS